MHRILVTGGSGLLGSAIALEARWEHTVATTYNRHPVSFSEVECIQIDLTEPQQYSRLREFEPDAIIHCAALTDVDECERRPTKARTYNVEMARELAELADDIEARFVHISSDAVFDGTGGRYTETDDPNPINIYGETKLEAERAVKQTRPDTVVVRTNIYGWNVTAGQSLAEWMVSELENSAELTAFEDVYISPIYTRDLADCLLELVDTEFQGLLHVGGQQRCSKLEFAYELADIFSFDTDRITPISIDEIEFDAPRGKDLSLSVSRAQELLDCSLPTIQEGLQRMKKDER